MSTLLNVKNLGFKYGDKEILKDVNFELYEGDFIGILGPNGSGKTTLLNNINRWLKPHKGCILLNNKDVMQFSAKKLAKHMATVPQNTFTDATFTVLEVVMMGRYPYLKTFEPEKKEDFAIVKDVMRYMNVWHLRDRLINVLSGGERQRVMIAKALAQQPKLLLLDEPTSHLDINYQYELLYLLKKLCIYNKLTIVAILHDLNLASMFCDKMILLKDHKVFKMGQLTNVLTEKNIKEVFNVDVKVEYDKDACRPIIIPLDNKKITDINKKNSPKIHVICGGGKGIELLKYLYTIGCNVSTGILNIGDSDWQTANLLGIDVIEEKPFSPISDTSMQKNKRYIYNSDIIVLANIPFGYGNLKNLICIAEMLDIKKVYIIEEDDIQHRDYTSGLASKIYNKIRNKAIIFNSITELKRYFLKNDF